MDSDLGVVALAAAAAGFVAHWTWFIRGEHLLWGSTYLFAALLGPPLTIAALIYYFDFAILQAIGTVAVACSSFTVALFLSIGIYRRFLHPLRDFPGPNRAKYSALWHISQVADKVDNFRHLERLHAQYGDYVRITPNAISVADPAFVDPIHNAHTRFNKSEWYQGGWPMTTLHQMRDKAMHDARRRHGWDKAFTTKSLRAYDGRQLKYTDQLVNQIRKRAGQSVNATEWLNYFAFDVMGDLAFGRSFQALEKGEKHFYIDLIHKSAIFPGVMGHVTWLLQLMMLVPLSWTDMGRMLIYSNECVEERKKNEPKEADIMSHILEAGDFFPNDEKREKLLLTGDARLLIVAGSDTTATTLVYCFYHLATDPSLVKNLRAELAAHDIANDDKFEVQPLQYLNYLNALINETLRMHPPVPGGVFRDSPPEGIEISGVRIPGNIKVIAAHQLIQRSPKAFVDPNKFIPERWTTRPDLILNKNAFFPFITGKFSCIGKQLALSELRTVISKMVLEFDVELAEGEDGRRLLTESKDVFTMSNAELRVVWKERKD